MAKSVCKECGTSLLGQLINGARQRRCTSCHRAWKASFGKESCNNCGVEIINNSGICETCLNHYPNPRVLTKDNINEMIWYEGRKAWE